MKSKLCRICCSKEATSYIFLKSNDIDLRTKIMYCCPKIDIKQEDGLSSFICKDCERKLEVCYKFILKCEATDKYLRSQSYIPCTKDKYLESRMSPIDVKTEINYEGDYDHCFEDPHSDNLPHAQGVQENEILKVGNIDPQMKNNSEEKVNENIRICRNKCNKIKTRYKNTAPYKCPVCGREYTRQSALIIHMRTHSNNCPFSCSLCDKKYKDSGSLKRHKNKHHSVLTRVRNFICESCGKRFFRQTDVTVHMRTHTGETPYACDQCSSRFSQLGALIRHKKRHTGEKDHMCSICPKRFCTKEELKMHLIVHSTEKKYECSLCNTLFKHQSNLMKHKKRHLECHNFICNYCQRNFKFKGNLKLHIERRHSEKSGFCEVCSRHVPNLETHMWRHNGKRPFKCEMCTSSFYELRALAHHINFKHTKTDRFKCDVNGCSMMFPSKPMLDFHIAKLHSTEVPFPCDQCARGFYRKNDLARHKIGSHKEKCG